MFWGRYSNLPTPFLKIKSEQMDIEIYDSSNNSSRSGQYTVNFHWRGGIYFSKKVSELMEVTEEDYIKIWRNKTTNDWYIAKTTSNTGFKVRIKKFGLFINSKAVVKAIFSNMKIEKAKSVCFSISQEPVQYMDMKGYCILEHTKKVTEE